MRHDLSSSQIFLAILALISNNPYLLFSIAGALVSFLGCSSATYLQVYAHQPVYFGSPPQNIIPVDSAQVQFVSPLFATTSHTIEKEKITTAKNVTITTGGVEVTEDNVVLEIRNALETDSDRFISDVSIRAKVEAYIPWYSLLSPFFGSIIAGDATSSGAGEASSETIEISGKVYKHWWYKR